MKYIIMLLAIPCFLISCSRENTAVLWSSNIEASEIVELYNNSHSEYRIIYQYKENLVSSYIKAIKKPDIIIGENLQSSDIKAEMISLDTLLKRSDSEANLNEHLMKGVYLDQEKRLTPLSYSLTAAVFRKSSKRIDRSIPAIELAQIMRSSVAFNKDLNKKGYSPFWDKEFIFAVLELYGSGFTTNDSETLSWNEENLNSALSFLNGWNELNGGNSEMDLFNSKYLYDNRIKLLKEERILFTTMKSSEYLRLSDNMNRDLDFLYITANNSLHPANIVYGGISRSTQAFNASTDFLSWLLTAETQKNIIESSLKNKNGNIGVLGGFSSLDDVNKQIIPVYYPSLGGKIPEPEYLLPQTEKPVDFDSIKHELITDWILDTSNGDDISLNDALKKWEKLRIPF